MPEVKPNPIAIALNVEPGEGGRLALLFTQSFFVGIVLVSFYTASSALFLSTYGSGKIPHMYIVAAVISAIIGSVYTWFQKSRGTSASVFATSLFLLTIVISFRFSLDRQANDVASFGLLAWYPVIYALLAVTLWHSAGRLFDVRQGKRLFGLIGAGELLASVLGGLSTPFFVTRYGAENLLFISILGLLFNLALTVLTIRIYRDRMVENVIGKVHVDDTDRLRDAIRSRYVVLLFVLYLLVVSVTHLVDFTFYDQARIRYKDQNALANYFGLFFAVTQGAALTMVALVSGRFISRFGIKIGMRVRPITILICAIFTAGLWFSGSTIVSFFFMSTVTKFLDLVLVRSFSGPSFLVLYQPLRPRRKFTVQVAIESMVGPVAGGLVGCVLLLLFYLDASHIGFITVVMLGVIAFWIVTGRKVYGEYRNTLSEALMQRFLEGGSSIYDDSMIDILKKHLTRPHPGEVIYALDLLDKIEDESSADHYVELLDHPSAEVRKEILDRIRTELRSEMIDAVRCSVAKETGDDVKSHALRSLCALGESEVLDEVVLYIDHPAPQVRRGVISGMLRYGGIDGVLTAGQHLIDLEHSEDVEDRIFAARVLGDVGISSFYRPLVRLLHDDIPEVRVASLLASGEVKSPRLWPLVLAHLELPRYHSYAAQALVRAGERALVPIREVLGSEEFGREVKVRAATICGRISGQKTLALLIEFLTVLDRNLRKAICTSLHECGFRAQGVDIVNVRSLIQEEVSDIGWLSGIQVDVENESSCELLSRAIEYEVSQARHRIFLMLTFLYDPQTVLRSEENLSHQSSQQRAYALEVLETTVSRDVRRLILPVLERDRPQDVLVALEDTFPQERLPVKDRISELLGERDRWVSPWMRSCVLYAAKETIGSAIAAAAELLAEDPEPLVRETAKWVIRESSKQENPDEESDMLLTIERVLVLKSVNLFSEVPEEVLAALAAVMEEREVEGEETIYEKGGSGRSMYIIVSGGVRIHDGDRTFVQLGERDFFGELTTLDPEPHSASVTSTQPTTLLGLDREGLYELMSDHPEVLRKIIHELCKRLRRKS